MPRDARKRIIRSGLAALFAALTGAPAGAAPTERLLIACLVGEAQAAEVGPCSTTTARKASLALIVESSAGGTRKYFGAVRSVRVDGRAAPVAPYPDAAKAIVRWFKVEPRMFHEDRHGHDPANPQFLWYANAGAPGGKTDRQPLPPDTITYHDTELSEKKNQWLIVADAHPTDPFYDKHDGLGTMRYSASLENADGSVRLVAPTLESFNPDLGRQENAARVVIRRDDSYLGYLTGYFNVPGVFGPYDVEIKQHLGVDCSHMAVNAWREYAGRDVPFTNVTGLRTNHVRSGYLRLVAGDLYLDSTGRLYKTYDAATRRLSDEAAVEAREGDLLVFEYTANPKRRQWDHVGMLFKHLHAGPNLGAEDLLIQAGPAEPDVAALASDAFVEPNQPTRVAVLRWVKASRASH